MASADTLKSLAEQAMPDGPTVALALPPVLRGAHRYQLLRELGHGGQGTVFEAEDLDGKRRVAVKMLRALGTEALSRFKREYRTRERVAHRCLVEFGELARDGSTWFFTMSLIEGVPLLEHLRSEGSEPHLRACFAQLMSAIMALHAAGLVHRDIKSENVLVESSGRVVLLDLGLVVAAHAQPSTQVMGTPQYMAPEQWSGTAVSQAADWYAFGVLLFEALAHRPPFEGNHLELFLAKTQHDAPLLHELAPDAPEELAELCDGLLRRDPTLRFGAREVELCLCKSSAEDVQTDGEAPLFGRTRELAALESALAETAASRCVQVVLEGASGIGKTALLDMFVGAARARGVQWVFSGRCYETESVPFNAFDELLEALARRLRHGAKASLDVYRPRHVDLLIRGFPVFAFMQQRRCDSTPPIDPAEVRVRAIRALLELLARMADESPVVLCVDDLHWADADSMDLIAALGDADFPLLLILGMRAGTALRKESRAIAGARVLSLAPLDVHATRLLAQRIAPDLALQPDAVFEELHVTTGGSPFLICEWARFVHTHGSAPTQALRELLVSRISQLSSPRRTLLALMAVSREPLEQSLVVAISRADEIADVAALSRDRLLRTVTREGTTYLDVYHDCIRDAARGMLDAVECTRLQGEVALALERNGAPAERQIAHQLASGNTAKAAALAVAAARSAEQTLAFRRAAEFYELALTLAEPEPDMHVELCTDMARAWQNAHCPRRAGEALLVAARSCREQRRARVLLRGAGEQLLLSGALTPGLATLEEALADHGLELAPSAESALGAALMAVRDLIQRGLEPAAEPSGDPRHHDRVMLCLSLARCLLHVDLRGLPFAIRGLQLALDGDDTALLQQALATFVMVTAGHLPNPLVEPAYERCRVLTEQSSDGYAQAMFHLATAEIEHFRGRYSAAEGACEQAEQILLDRCVGVSRELGQVRSIALVMAHSKGDFRTHAERAPAWLEDADRRGDLFYGNWLRAAQSLAWMAQDQPERARREIAHAEEHWPAGLGGTFETACALYLDALDRYEDVPDVHERPAQARQSVLRSPVAQSALLQGYIHLQCAWGCLRELGARGGQRSAQQRSELLKRARDAVIKMRALGVASWTSVADALEANIAVLNGRRDEASQLLARAHAGLVDAHTFAFAACAKRRRGELVGGELGNRWVHEAEADLMRLGVRAPARYAQAYFSPFVVPE